jgi:hypothetical protein
LLEELLDELAVAIFPIAQLHEFNPHLDVQLNVKCSSVLKLDVDFMSVRVIGQNMRCITLPAMCSIKVWAIFPPA